MDTEKGITFLVDSFGGDVTAFDCGEEGVFFGNKGWRTGVEGLEVSLSGDFKGAVKRRGVRHINMII